MRPVNDTQMLQHISKTCEMGINSLQEVLKHPISNDMRRQLKEQQEEYGEMYTLSRTMLRRRGARPQNISTLSKFMAGMNVRREMKLHGDNKHISKMVKKGNVMGLNKSIQTLNMYSGKSDSVRSLAVKLMHTEKSNIDSLKRFMD